MAKPALRRLQGDLESPQQLQAPGQEVGSIPRGVYLSYNPGCRPCKLNKIEFLQSIATKDLVSHLGWLLLNLFCAGFKMAWRVLNNSRHQVYQPAPLDSGGMRGCPPQGGGRWKPDRRLQRGWARSSLSRTRARMPPSWRRRSNTPRQVKVWK